MATQQTVLTREVLDTLPNGRQYYSVGELAPGVITRSNSGTAAGGSMGRDAQVLTVHGSGMNDFALLLDGFPQTNLFNTGIPGVQGVMPADGLNEEVNVLSGGNPAEADSGGVRVNLVPKSGGNRQPLPPGQARRREPPRHSGTGKLSHGHLAGQSNVRGRPWQVDHGESARLAAAAAAAKRSGTEGKPGERPATDAAGTNGGASRQSGVRELSCAHGPDRLRARELRRGGTVADAGRLSANRRRVGSSGRDEDRRTGRPAEDAPEPARTDRDDGHREAAHVCARSRPRAHGRADRSQHRPKHRARQLSPGRARGRHYGKHAISNAARALATRSTGRRAGARR